MNIPPVPHIANLLVAKNTPFILRDEFFDTCAAGAINGTTATDGAVRTVTDSASKMSVANGHLTNVLGVVNGDPRISYPIQSKVRGKTLISAHQTTGVSAWYVAWDADLAGLPNYGLVTNGTSLVVNRNSGVTFTVGTYVANTLIYFASVLRTTGVLNFVKGGGNYPDWTLVYSNPLSTGASLYPSAVNGGTTLSAKTHFIRIPSKLFLFSPITADSFVRANGALGTSDGVGTDTGEVASTLPAWTVPLGTFAISTNDAASTVLSGGVAYAYLPCTCPDVYVEVPLIRTAGSAGILLRYTDANNYIKVIHNGTQVIVTEVVGGTPNVLQTTTSTYASNGILHVALRGNKLRVYYNTGGVGGEVTTALTTGNNFGLYSETTTALFHTFTCWGVGMNGEYSTLNLGL